MPQAAILQKSIFVEDGDGVFYVTNWQRRFTVRQKALLVRLSPRHLTKYRDLIGKGRSHKSIYFALFRRAKKNVAKRAVTSTGIPVSQDTETNGLTVQISIDLLNREQIYRLMSDLLACDIPALKELGLPDLKKLYRAIVQIRNAS